MSWRGEHGDEFAIPAEILHLEGLRDVSWHNDVCPSFEADVVPEQQPFDLRIWVEHPDPAQRDSATEDLPRFCVTLADYDLSEAQVAEFCRLLDIHGEPVFYTDDVHASIATFMTWLFTIRQVIKETS